MQQNKRQDRNMCEACNTRHHSPFVIQLVQHSESTRSRSTSAHTTYPRPACPFPRAVPSPRIRRDFARLIRFRLFTALDMSSRPAHRPRSHSVCASPIQEDTWSMAIKRANPHHPFRNDFPTTQTWDVEAWSSGRKRVRRHIDVCMIFLPECLSSDGGANQLPVSLSNDDESSSACTRRLATLPFTSAEFDFY